MFNNTNNTSAERGFEYQELVLIYSFQKLREKKDSNYTFQYEVDGDVTVYLDGKPEKYIECKHHDTDVNLTNKNTDFTNTLKNICEREISGKKAYKEYILVTTSKNTIKLSDKESLKEAEKTKQEMFYKKEIKKQIKKIVNEQNIEKNKEQKNILIKTYNERTKNLYKKINIYDEMPKLEELRSMIENIFVNCDKERVLFGLKGLIKRTLYKDKAASVIDLTRKITINELEQEYSHLQDIHKSNNDLTIGRFDRKREITEVDFRFSKQLKQIGINDKKINLEIRRYFHVVDEKGKILKKNRRLYESFDFYDEDVLERLEDFLTFEREKGNQINDKAFFYSILTNDHNIETELKNTGIHFFMGTAENHVQNEMFDWSRND